MVDRRVPGFSKSSAMAVTPTEVVAAKLQVKLARQLGETVDPAVEAIANALPQPSREDEFAHGAHSATG